MKPGRGVHSFCILKCYSSLPLSSQPPLFTRFCAAMVYSRLPTFLGPSGFLQDAYTYRRIDPHQLGSLFFPYFTGSLFKGLCSIKQNNNKNETIILFRSGARENLPTVLPFVKFFVPTFGLSLKYNSSLIH